MAELTLRAVGVTNSSVANMRAHAGRIEVAQGCTSLLKDAQVLWLSHTDDNEQFPGTNAKLAAFALRNGYREEPVSLYYDRNGRAVFQTFRMVGQ